MNFLSGGLLGSLLSHLGKGEGFGNALKETGRDFILSNPFSPLAPLVRRPDTEPSFQNLMSGFLYNYARRRRRPPFDQMEL